MADHSQNFDVSREHELIFHNLNNDPVGLIREAVKMLKQDRGNFDTGSPEKQAFDQVCDHGTAILKFCDKIETLEEEYPTR